MSIRSATLFDANGRATPLFLAQWKTRIPAAPIQSAAVLVENQRPTPYFTTLWKAAFPSRAPLPKEAVANPDGTGTALFWYAFA